MATIWVTGAHGFIGRHLAKSLAADGVSVCGIGHGHWPKSEAQQWGIHTWVNGSVEAANLSLLSASSSVPDTVFHLAGGSSVGAASTNPSEDFRRTVVSTSELLEWLRLNARQARIVAVSSAAVYGANYENPITETAETAPCSVYGSHKLMMEDLCRYYSSHYGLHVVLPRLFSVYGCGLKKQLLWDLCEKLASGESVELSGSGDELRDWIEVRDVVRGLQRVVSIASDEAPCVNLATGQGTSVREVSLMVSKFWSARNEAPAVSFSRRIRPGDPFSLVADVHRLQQLQLKLEITPSEGIEAYIKWYQNLATS